MSDLHYLAGVDSANKERQIELEKVNDCINTAVNIVNLTDDESIKEMAAHIADQLISLTKIENL